MSEGQSGEIKQVTKAKHPGRQKAGYKVAEWNRKNKEDLKKNQKQEPSSEISTAKSSQSSEESSEISTTKKSNDVYLYSIGILCLSLLAIGGLVYFKSPSKSAEETIKEKKPIQQKIFRKML